MIDTDDAKSKRNFKKLSKCMGDKLDKEKEWYVTHCQWHYGQLAPAATKGSHVTANLDDIFHSTSLDFPSFISDDFRLTALLYPTPTVMNSMTYDEEAISGSPRNSDGFSIVRLTIELPLDDLISTGSMIDICVKGCDVQKNVKMSLHQLGLYPEQRHE
ncbi:uncharacterized protein LAESUDRAFT_755354 [Laetiporus sulphureus 93-53]|uniref:Uncharacterized protein n=1 Tax=Laetiporus sulphureus 93-53 TaxID=1314785 RepID=A0A165GQD4_9APHY|nr:uncharacterized protein LAESUDRAFT_755354 [Laetiporus sulphureus 93-53]KZT10661.1 hypothetical protein LAESUDRAFT_755354 [Laetiporus sulphureus 93-53]